MSVAMTEHQKMRAQIAAQIMANQLPDGAVLSCHTQLSANAKQAIDGALRIAEEILERSQKFRS